MPTGNLPAAGKKIWEEVHTKAKSSSTCKDSPDPEACAAKVAWTAVHNAGWKKDAKGEWHKSEVLTEFSLHIDRASYDKASGERRVRAAASDVEEDNRGDNMSLELFNDFIDRIKRNESVPVEFQSEFWRGGEPYFSVSHYPDGNGKTVPGIIDATYVDGKFLKSKGKFFDTPLGRKCFEAVCADLYGEKSNTNNKVRISIAFLDYMHKHKSNGYVFDRSTNPDTICPECFLEMIRGESKGKIFLKGHLIHEALTRVPVNTRTSLEVDKSMAEKSITRKDDATSIVGEELADELEELAEKVVDKSESLVIRSDEKVDEAQVDMPIKVSPPTTPDEGAGEQAKEENPAMADDEVVCPNCSSVVVPTDDNTCPVCGAPLGEGQMNGTINGVETVIAPAKSEVKVENAVTKKEGSESYPSSDYLIVEKPDEPSTWHLQVKKHGKPDHGLMGGAKAALTSPGGHRGNKYEGPNKAEAISKLKALYAKEKMDWNAKSEAEIESDALYLRSLVVETVKSVMKELAMTEPIIPAPVSAHPLDVLFTEFKSKFDEAVKTDLSEAEKLQMIQEPFNALGNEIVSVIKSSIKPPAPEVKAQSDLVSALSQVMTPIGQKLDLLIAQSSTPALEHAVPVIPPRRSIPPASAVQVPVNQTQTVVKSQTPKLRALVEKLT